MRRASQRMFCAFVVTLGVFADPAAAWSQTTTTDAEAEQFYDAALDAKDSGELESALFELDRAWRLKKDYRYIYQRVLVLEAMGRASMAKDLLEANRDGLLADPRITDFYVVEERLRDAASGPSSSDDGRRGVAQTSPPPARSKGDWIGALALGTAGIGLTVWGATLFADECTLESTTGACIQGHSANMPLATSVTGVGIAALVGAVVWFIVTSPETPPPPQTRITVSPGGFHVSF